MQGDSQEVRQHLCALYRAEDFACIPGFVDSGSNSIRTWVNSLKCRVLTTRDLASNGFEATVIANANIQAKSAALTRAALVTKETAG